MREPIIPPDNKSRIKPGTNLATHLRSGNKFGIIRQYNKRITQYHNRPTEKFILSSRQGLTCLSISWPSYGWQEWSIPADICHFWITLYLYSILFVFYKIDVCPVLPETQILTPIKLECLFDLRLLFIEKVQHFVALSPKITYTSFPSIPKWLGPYIFSDSFGQLTNYQF